MVWPSPQNVGHYVRQERVRTVHYGIDAVGAAVVRQAMDNPNFEIVGAIDSRPARIGRDLGEVVAAGRRLGVSVAYDPESVLRDVYADVVVYCGNSNLTLAYPELLHILETEKSVITTCNELVFPWPRLPEVAQRLDQKARERGVRLFSVGRPSGFVLGVLPLLLTSACQQLKAIQIEAVSDLSAQSIEAQRGAGAGLTVQGFERAMAAGEIASLEPQEVCYLLADTVGWQLEQVLVNVEPVLARDRLKSENFSIDKGQVIGLRTSCRGMVSGREVVRITVETALGTPDRASIYLDGTPPVSLTLPSGLQSADSTAALIISCLPFMARSQSPLGLLTLRDLPLIPYWRKKTVSAGEQHPL